MPKIVDHAAHREELARKAASLFSQHGYSGLGMRKIAQELGVSKSALYHYFPTKKDLFLACTAIVVARPPVDMPTSSNPPEENIERLIDEMRAGFAGEMSLLFDYLRGMSPEEIKKDPAMRMALEAQLKQVAEIVGDDQAHEKLASIMGTLMLEYFSGGPWRKP